jgi:hypothetical protein
MLFISSHYSTIEMKLKNNDFFKCWKRLKLIFYYFKFIKYD